jgi:hypothetical protein
MGFCGPVKESPIYAQHLVCAITEVNTRSWPVDVLLWATGISANTTPIEPE